MNKAEVLYKARMRAAWSAARRVPCGRTLRRRPQFALAPAIASLVCIPGFLPQACSGFTMPALAVGSLPPLRACPRAPTHVRSDRAAQQRIGEAM